MSASGVYRSLGALALAFSLAACESATAPTFVGQPPLPPMEAIFVDLSLFLDPQGPGVGSHFSAAAERIMGADAVTTSNMPLPVTLFAAAQDLNSVSQSDGYHWIYSVTAGAVIADVDLRARASGTRTALWEMKVSSGSTSPALNSFVLLTGTTSLIQTQGTWRLFKASTPTTPQAVLDITWSHEGTSTWRVTYVNIDTGSDALGDYLDFERTGELRRVSHFDESTGVTTIVDWNVVTHVGQIVASDFNGGLRGCWNASLVNAAC